MSTLDSASSRPFEIEHPFLVCPENRFAYSATFGIAEPRNTEGLFVTVFGPTGTGKTHLLREAARNFARRKSTARIAQTTGHEIAELIVAAITTRTIEQFRDDYTNVNLLLCDGLDEVPATTSIQEQLLVLFDEVASNGGVILLASSRPPGELRRLSKRLVSRCHGGISAEVGLPDAASRRKLLQHFATAHHLRCPDPVIEELAQAFEVNGRELLSLLKRLHEFSRIRKRTITTELLQELIHGESVDEPVALVRVAQAVAAEFGISLREMQSHSRARRSLVSRQTAMLLAREIAETPLSEIGAFFGGRNHSTVVHACHRARQLIKVDREVASTVAQIRESLATARGYRCRKPDRHSSAPSARAG